MQGGTVVEEGTHSALYRDEASVYHSLVRLQEQATDKRDEMAGEVNLEEAVAADEAEAEAAVAAARESSDLRDSGTQSASARRTSGLESRGVPQASRKSLELAAKSSKGEVVSAKELVEAAADAGEDELVRRPKASWYLVFSSAYSAVPYSRASDVGASVVVCKAVRCPGSGRTPVVRGCLMPVAAAAMCLMGHSCTPGPGSFSEG